MASLPLLLFSIKENKIFNKKMIKQGNENLNIIIKSNSKNWEELRKKYIKAYRLYFWQKFI
jgi:hypothetical protein